MSQETRIAEAIWSGLYMAKERSGCSRERLLVLGRPAPGLAAPRGSRAAPRCDRRRSVCWGISAVAIPQAIEFDGKTRLAPGRSVFVDDSFLDRPVKASNSYRYRLFCHRCVSRFNGPSSGRKNSPGNGAGGSVSRPAFGGLAGGLFRWQLIPPK